MLRLRVLATGGRDRRRHFRIYHRHAGVEEPRHPAGNQRSNGATFADGEIPTHIFADENDADPECPDVTGPENAKQRDLLAVNCCCLSHRCPP